MKSIPDVQAAYFHSRSSPVFIFKHSTQCGISSRALLQFQEFMGKESLAPVCYQVDVIEFRKVSDELERLSQIRHESPQVLLFWNEQCVWSSSHGRIKTSELHNQAVILRQK